MRPLAAIDLDDTLITIDSFHDLVRRQLDAALMLLVIRRSLGLLDRTGFVARVSRHLAGVLADAEEMGRFVDSLERKLDPEVLEMARSRAAGGALTLVLSASPQEYVSRFAERLGFAGIGSYWDGQRFVHCWGEGKRQVLLQRFPPDDYSYDFAVSDSPSDAPLLKMFRESLLYRRRR